MRLRRAVLGLLLAAGALPGAAAATVVTIDELSLEMKPRDADVLFKKYFYDTSTFPVAIVQPDGSRLTGRIEVKGETARVFDKKPVLIKLDRGMKWRGHSRISLNAMATDSSWIREWLSWDLVYALGMPAPETGYVRLRINGADRGMFFRIEWVGPNVFERHGFGDDGEMFDPVDRISCADLSPKPAAEVERCWGKISPRDGDFTPLRRLAEAIAAEPLATFDAFLEREFDAESVVNWIAVTVIVENLTTYNNEYWPYFSRTLGKWVIMPWDYDRTFGKNYDPDLPYPRNKINDNFQYYYPLELGASNALRDKLFKQPASRQRIERRIAEIIDGAPDAQHRWRGWFEPERMAARIDALQAALAPEVARDPGLARDPARFERDVASVRHFSVARAHYLRRILAPFRPGAEPDRGAGSLPPAGRTLHVTDGWGYMMARLTPRADAAGTVAVVVHRGWPELVPPGADRDACVQRSWLIAGPPGLDADVTVEYLEETSRASEVGPQVASELDLALYLRDARGWWRLPTSANDLANTLSTRLRLRDGSDARLVACAPPTLATR